MSRRDEVERPLPHSEAFEQAVLGLILVGHKHPEYALDRLVADDFYDVRNRKIFAAIAGLATAGRTTDLLSVDDELLRLGELKSPADHAYLAGLIDGLPQVGNLLHYAQGVKNKARLRAVIHAAHALYERAFEAADPVELIVDEGIEDISTIAGEIAADSDEGTSCLDAAAELLSYVRTDGEVRVRTGIESLDRITGGFRGSELIVYVAETGVGKTLLAQQTRRHACAQGQHSVYFSGEMLSRHLIGRELAAEAQVAPWKIRQPERITSEELRALIEAGARECRDCRIVDGELSLARVRRIARAAKKRTRIGLVVLDYDELIDAPGEDEFEQQKNLARGAKSLAVELRIPVILISQLRKPLSGEDAKRPTLQRLYGSGAKVKHASVVLFLDRPFIRDLKGDETGAKLLVLKNRDGKVGRIEGRFNIRTLRFEDAPGE